MQTMKKDRTTTYEISIMTPENLAMPIQLPLWELRTAARYVCVPIFTMEKAAGDIQHSIASEMEATQDLYQYHKLSLVQRGILQNDKLFRI